jgi:hypothetical protein
MVVGPKDIKGSIRICISKKNRQHNGQKIPKGQSESVYQRRTDNTMAKRYQRINRVLSVNLRFTDSDYPFGIVWSLCCLSILDLRILITHLAKQNGAPELTPSFKESPCCLIFSFLCSVLFLCPFSVGHCVVCPS